MPINGAIFQGVTTSPCRDFVYKLLSERESRKVFMPCAGRFGSAQSYIQLGGSVKSLYTSDICAYSSFIGYLFDSRKDFEELELEVDGVFKPLSKEPIDLVASAFLTYKFDSIGDKSIYAKHMQAQMVRDKDMLLEEFVQQVKDVCEVMKGAKYDIVDFVEVVEKIADKEDCAMFVNPPAFSGGYEKMFESVNVKWKEPNIKMFDHKKQFPQMLEKLSVAKCFAVVYCVGSLQGVDRDKWKVVFAEDKGFDKQNYLISNNPKSGIFVTKKPEDKRKPKIYEIYSDQEITPESKIEVMITDSTTALYYRSLFIHRLGVTSAQNFMIMLIDGRVFAAIGFDLAKYYMGTSEYLFENFGITKTSERYRRLDKLLMSCLCSGEFKLFITEALNLKMREAKGIRTTSLWRDENVGKNKRDNVVPVVEKKKMPDGTWKVSQQQDFDDRTYSDCVQDFLRRWGNVDDETKGQQKKKKKTRASRGERKNGNRV